MAKRIADFSRSNNGPLSFSTSLRLDRVFRRGKSELVSCRAQIHDSRFSRSVLGPITTTIAPLCRDETPARLIASDI